MISGYRVENGVQIYNDGAPAPPGWSVTFCCCIPMFKVSGIPEGTPRVPEDEAKAILARWQGRYKIVSLSSPPGIKGDVVSFTDVHVKGDILEISGGTRMIHTQHGTIHVPNQPQKQRVSLWRGADGVLYIDNIGSKLVRESPTQLEMKNALGFGLRWDRVAPAPMQMERGEESAPTKWASRPTSPGGQGVAGGWSEKVVTEAVPESGQKASAKNVVVEIDGESWPVA